MSKLIYYVEILSRHAHLRERHRLDELPATIGRAYDCDVLVDDEFVSPHHLRLEVDADGVPVAVDLDSKNGVYALRPERKVSRQRVEADTELRIGRTLLRVRTANAAVPDAKPDTLLKSRSAHWFGSPIALVLAVVAMTITIVMTALVTDYSEEQPMWRIVSVGLPVVTALFFWIGMWAVASRLATHQFFLVAHANIACSFVVVVAAVAFVQALWNFTLVSVPLAKQLFSVIWWLLFAVLLGVQLRYVTAWGSLRAAVVSLAVAGFLTLVSLLGNYAERESVNDHPDFNATILPLEFKLQSDIDRADLLNELHALHAVVDADLKK